MAEEIPAWWSDKSIQMATDSFLDSQASERPSVSVQLKLVDGTKIVPHVVDESLPQAESTAEVVDSNGQ